MEVLKILLLITSLKTAMCPYEVKEEIKEEVKDEVKEDPRPKKNSKNAVKYTKRNKRGHFKTCKFNFTVTPE